LYISQDFEKRKYLALSYCWGGPQLVPTQSATLQENLKTLSMDSLPRTIQDGIILTRCLGFQYLWVDTLCILQDSDTDKDEEIQRIGGAYKNSTITIAAACAANVNEGFLEVQHRKFDVQVPFLLSDGSIGKVEIRANGPWPYPQDPIDLRAWTLQETLLAPTVLSVGKHKCCRYVIQWRLMSICRPGNETPTSWALGCHRQSSRATARDFYWL
jgi:hypothetical protein